MPLFRPIWEALSRNDDDFRVALVALEDALRHEGIPQICRDLGDGRAEESLRRLGLAPRPALQAVSPAEVTGISAQALAMLDCQTRKLTDELQIRIDAALFQPEPPAALRPSLFEKVLRGIRGLRDSATRAAGDSTRR
jgi:hypothetical protein